MGQEGVYTGLLSAPGPSMIEMPTAVGSPGGLATSSQDPVSIVRLVRTAAALTPKELRPKREIAVAVEKSMVCDMSKSGYIKMWMFRQQDRSRSVVRMSG